MTLELSPGKQVVVNSDMGKLWLSLWANQGNLGVELTPQQAMEIGLTLFQMGRRGKRC